MNFLQKPSLNSPYFDRRIFALALVMFTLLTAMFLRSARGYITANDFLPQLMLGGFILVTAVLCSWELAIRGLSSLAALLYFFFFFYGLAPLICFRTGLWLFGDISGEKRDLIIKVSLYSYLFLGTFFLGYKKGFALLWGKVSPWLERLDRREIRPFGLFLTIPLQIGVAGFLVAALGMQAMIYRGADVTVTFDSFWIVVLTNYVRPLSFFIFIVYLVRSRGNGSPQNWALAALLGLLAIAGNFPVSLARFYLFTLLIVGAYALLFGGRFWRLASVCILGLSVFGSVITDGFRALGRGEGLSGALKADIDMTEYIFAGHFDAFEINVYTLDYVAEKKLEKGRQLLGVGLFWVPRIVWPGKPKPTGEKLGAGFIGLMESTKNTNLSCPLPAEGYIDFGIAGVLAFGFGFGSICGIFDKWLHGFKEMPKPGVMPVRRYGALMVGAVFVGQVIYIMRGALMPAFAYTLAIICAALTILFVFTSDARNVKRR